MSSDTEDEYIVIALTAALPKYVACNIIPKGIKFTQIHNVVYGPASMQNCLKWVVENCEGCQNTKMVSA